MYIIYAKAEDKTNAKGHQNFVVNHPATSLPSLSVIYGLLLTLDEVILTHGYKDLQSPIFEL